MEENTLATVKRKKVIEQLECRICGSSALHSFFGVITCQSCGVFFRRNAYNQVIC